MDEEARGKSTALWGQNQHVVKQRLFEMLSSSKSELGSLTSNDC